jgi:anti-sigma factor RsiW
MRCRKVRERLDEHLTGTLSKAEAARIAAHLEHCPLCRAEWQRLRQVETVLHRSKPLTAPPSLAEQIMAAVAEQQRREMARAAARAAPPSRSYWRAVWLGAVLAILATVLVAVLIAVQPGIVFQGFAGVPMALTTGSDLLQIVQEIGAMLVQNRPLLIAVIVIYAGAVLIWLRLMHHAEG